VSTIARWWLVCGLVSIFCFGQASSSRPEASSAQNPTSSSAAPAASDGQTASEARTALSVPNKLSVLAEASLCYRKGDFAGAIAKYKQLMSEHPESPDAYAGLVHTYLKQKDVQQAAEAADLGMTQANSPRMRAARAEVWFRQGNIVEAEKEWAEIINSGHAEPRAYLGIATVRKSIAMYKSAKAFIDKAHELDSYDPDIQEAWEMTLSRAERIKYLQESLDGENNWSAEGREATERYLEYLKNREKEKRGACRLVSRVKETQTPLVRLLIDPTHLRGYGLSVILNGHKSSLMLDTGASGITVRRGIAEKAGISKISATKIWGVGSHGQRDAFIGIADSIKIGELEFQNCPVEVMESSSIVGEDGLIGADVFENFLVELNFPKEKLSLSQLPLRPGESEQHLGLASENDDSGQADDAANSGADAGKHQNAKQNGQPPTTGPQDRYIAPEMQSYARVFRFEHDLLIPTRIGETSPKLFLFLMDSGALINSISPQAASEVTKVHGDSDMKVEGISGKVDQVFTANKATLHFGHLRQENQDMTSFDTTSLSDSIGTEVSGFLGFTTLRFLDVKIDYRDALVDFEFDPSRWGR
jgi:tetratricopeptide (TPR) repeat protein